MVLIYTLIIIVVFVNMSVNFSDQLTGIRQVRSIYTLKIDIVTGNEVRTEKNIEYRVILEALRLVEPIPNQYLKQLVNENQIQEGQYYLVHLRHWSGDECKIGDIFYWNRSKINKMTAYTPSGDDDIVMEVKNIITSGLSSFNISSLEVICLANN